MHCCSPGLISVVVVTLLSVGVVEALAGRGRGGRIVRQDCRRIYVEMVWLVMGLGAVAFAEGWDREKGHNGG